MDPTDLNTLYDGLHQRKPEAVDMLLVSIKTGDICFSDIENIGLPKNATDALLYHGLLLDEMAESQVPQYHRALIRFGLKTEYYAKWKDSEDVGIRMDLAKRGYFVDHYLMDKSDDVRWCALKQKPEHIPEHFKDGKLLIRINNYYREHPHPNLDDYAVFLELNQTWVKQSRMIAPDPRVIERKRQSEGQPTTLEMSMTPRQLYEAGSPYWARHLSLDDIATIQNAEDLNVAPNTIATHLEDLVAERRSAGDI